MPPSRVAIVDDHPIFRDGLRELLAREPDITVVAEGTDGMDALRIVRELRPDVLLLDVAMPRLDGIAAMGSPDVGETRVIVLTAGIDEEQTLKAVQLGARGIVLKESATRQLIDAIHDVAAGRVVIDPAVAASLARAVGRQRTASPYGLTARETDIVRGLAEGRSNREIAQHLGIGLQTVKHHLTNIFAKTSTSTRLELALLAVKEQSRL